MPYCLWLPFSKCCVKFFEIGRILTCFWFSGYSTRPKLNGLEWICIIPWLFYNFQNTCRQPRSKKYTSNLLKKNEKKNVLPVKIPHTLKKTKKPTSSLFVRAKKKKNPTSSLFVRAKKKMYLPHLIWNFLGMRNMKLIWYGLKR